MSINLRLMRASWFAFSELYASFLSISSAVLMFMGVPFMWVVCYVLENIMFS